MDDAIFAMLRRKLARWAHDNWEALSKAQPQIPAGFHNRTRRNWWLLLAVAELAGADWADQARKAASSIEGVRDVGDVEVELLSDIKAIFDASKSAPGLPGPKGERRLAPTIFGGCFGNTASRPRRCIPTGYAQRATDGRGSKRLGSGI